MARKGYERKGTGPIFYKKVIVQWPNGRRRIMWQTPGVTFEKLSADDYLDTADLEIYFDVSARTVYRWINEFDLEPDNVIGRSLYFKKRTVVRWERENRPKLGRPFD